MIERMFMVVPTAVALVVVAVACLLYRVRPSRTLLYLTLTAYAGGVIAVTLFPLPIEPAFASMQTGGDSWARGFNFVPFAVIVDTIEEAAATGWWWTIAATIVGGNVVMFVPLGAMLPMLSDKLHKLWKTVVALAACSVGIELAQLVVGLGVAGYMYRVVDVDDVILNVVGGLIGYGLWRLAQAFRLRKLPSKWNSRDRSG